MKKINRDDADINYKVTGNGSTTLLFIHGSYIDQTYWDQQVAYFSPNYRVVTIDLPGHGESGRGRMEWSVQGFAEDVILLIRELKLQPVILVGHSLGAAIGLMVAVQASDLVKGFIAIDYFKNATIALPEQQVNSILGNMRTDFKNTNEQFARMALLSPETPQEIVDIVIRDYRHAFQPMGLQTMPEVFDMYKKEKELLPALSFKLYMINVDYLPTNEEPLRSHAGNGYDLVRMSGTCHFPMLESPEEFNTLVKQTIQKIEHAEP